MRKIIFSILLSVFLFSCNKDGGIVNPELLSLVFSNSGKWVEVVRVDSLGNERNDGNFTIESTLEFFDSTYEFTSKTIQLEDSTNILDDHFYLYHEGKFSSHSDTLTISTSDKIYSDALKTFVSKDTLRMGGILRCVLEGSGNVYSCIGIIYTHDEFPLRGYLTSFLWERFHSKTTATFIKK